MQTVEAIIEPSGVVRLLMHSAVLGLDLRIDDGRLRFYDPATGQKLRSHPEAEWAYHHPELARQTVEQARQKAKQSYQKAVLARQAAEARAEHEAAQRRALKARLAELEAWLRGHD